MTSFSSSYNDDGTVSGGITSREALTDQPITFAMSGTWTKPPEPEPPVKVTVGGPPSDGPVVGYAYGGGGTVHEMRAGQSLWGFVEAKIAALSCDDLETLNDFGELHDKIRDLAAQAYELGKQEGPGVRNGNG